MIVTEERDYAKKKPASYKTLVKPETVKLTYSLSFLGGRHQKDQGLRPAGAKGYQVSTSINKPCVVACPCDPSYAGGCREDLDPRVALGKSARSYLKSD
jgi:hypothetical protein